MTTLMGSLADASEITAVVDYCGAGGESQGLVEAGIRVVQAANHDELAIRTHSANHTETDHLLTDLLVQDPRSRPRAHIYQASPECKWHSPAGGRKRYRTMLDMFEEYVPDAAGQRSRATMLTVLSTAEAKRYPIVIVENVVEVSDWEMFEVWLAGFQALGYEYQILNVSAAHIWSERNAPAPQWRDRVYFVFYLKGIPFPDVSPRPWAFCQACGADVRSVQSWKRPDRRKVGKYGAQYFYACPVAGHPRVEPYVMPALDALDTSDLGERIGDKPLRKLKDKQTGEVYYSPLARATMRRIRVGALMFGGDAELVASHGQTYDAASPGHPQHGDPSAYHRVWPATDPVIARTSTPGDAFVTAVHHGGADDGRAQLAGAAPLPTRSGKLGDAVVSSYMVQRRDYDGPDASRVTSVEAPMPTRTASDRGIHGLVSPGPFLTEYYGQGGAQSTTEPIGTVSTREHHALATPFGVTLRNHAHPYPMGGDAAPTVTAGGNHHGVALAGAFLSKHHGGLDYRAIGHMNKPVTDPMPTIVGRPNVSLVVPTKRPKLTATPEEVDAVNIDDFRFRMLHWREHSNAQRFPRDYVFTGNNSVNTLHAGNAVAVNVSHYLGLMCRVALRDATAAALGFEWLEAA